MNNNGNGKKDRKITFENYRYIVDIVVNTKGFQIPPCLEKSDLYQIGCIALLDAIKTYDLNNKRNKGTFGTYAYYLVYYRILDELRRITKIKRRKTKKEYNPMETGMFSESSYFTKTVLVDGNLKEMITVLADEAAKSPLDEVQELLDIPLMKKEVYNALDARERIVLKLYAEHGKVLREIGELIGVCESRVSQIYTKVKRKAYDVLKEAIV